MPESQSTGEDSSQASALELISAKHQRERKQQIEAIKKRKVPDGKLGMRGIMAMVVVAAIICAVPGLVPWFGSELDYWMGLGVLGFFFAPMWGFIAAAIANAFGFPPLAQKFIGITTAVLMGMPAILASIAMGEANAGRWYLAGLWLVQIVAILATIWIFRLGK